MFYFIYYSRPSSEDMDYALSVVELFFMLLLNKLPIFYVLVCDESLLSLFVYLC